MRLLAIAVLVLSLPGCIFYSRWQESKQNAALLEQQALFVQDHRACLEENSKHPEKQRDCSVYNQSRMQVDVSGVK